METVPIDTVKAVLEKRYETLGRDFAFNMYNVSKKLGVKSHRIRHAVLALEHLKLVERTRLSNSRITWKTRFGKQNKME